METYPGVPVYIDDLTELPQWICWQYRGPLGKSTKVPISPKTGHPASTTNPKDWTDFQTALKAWNKSKESQVYDGLGFVFAADGGVVGIDLDYCLDQNNQLKSWGSVVLSQFDTYCEISPSGKGIKIWARGKIQGAGIKRYVDKGGMPIGGKAESDGAIEIYDTGRYFTVTGRAVKGFPLEVTPAGDALAGLESLLRGAGAGGKHVNGTAKKFTPKQTVAQGERHNYLLSMAASLWARGLTKSAILGALRGVNQEDLSEPKDDKEIIGIVEWVCKHPPGVPIPSNLVQMPPPGAPPPETPPAGSGDGGDDEPKSDLHLPGEGDEKFAPNDMAKSIMQVHQIICDQTKGVWTYTGQYWAEITAEYIRSLAMEVDTHKITSHKRRQEVAHYVMDSTRRNRIDWRQIADNEIPCKSGVLNVQTGAVRPHRSDDMLESVVPWEYHPGNNSGLWQQCLSDWFANEHDAVDSLQEFFGYCLLPHAKYKKALILYGESDTGKSQVPLVLRSLVGAENTCCLSTEQMADERKRAAIVGKSINLLTELSSDAMIADGGFKQLVSTGDPISIDPKYRAPFSYVGSCKHVICTNRLPAINDQSKATYNRLLIIKYTRVVDEERKDPELLEKLIREMPAIFVWAIEGARRLVSRYGIFTEPTGSRDMLEQYRKVQTTILQFFDTCCKTGDKVKKRCTPFAQLLEAYTLFSKDRRITRKSFGTMLIQHGYSSKSVSMKYFDFERKKNRWKTVEMVFGITLNESLFYEANSVGDDYIGIQADDGATDDDAPLN